MGNCVTDWIFRRQRFCCCLPARLGAGLFALLAIILSCLLAVILWLEVASNDSMSGKEKTAFILAGILESLLFVASVLGFIGVCAKKQLFVVVFATFLYVHFFINLGVAAYFLWMITHTANTDVVKLCEAGIRNEQAQGQCKGLLKITKGVYWGVSLFVLAIEAYCALVVTRYVIQIRSEKRGVRRSRLEARKSAYAAYHERFASGGSAVSEANEKHYSALSDLEGDKEGLLNAPRVQLFDPYAAYDSYDAQVPRRSYSPSPTPTLVPAPTGRNSRVGASTSSDSEESGNTEYHRNVAEAQLTSRSKHVSVEKLPRDSSEGGRGRNSEVLALPPGAAPAIPPTTRSRESSLSPAIPPPPSYNP